MSLQKASNMENLEHFHGPLTQICTVAMLWRVFPIFVTRTSLVLLTGEKSMVFFIFLEIINLKNSEKKEEIENFRP